MARLPRTRLAALVSVILVLAAASAGFTPAIAQVEPSFNLHLGLADARFIGATWMLEAGGTTLNGTVGADGNVDVTLPLTTVQGSIREGLQFLATTPLDANNLLVAAAMEARDPTMIVGGGTLTFRPVVVVTPMRTYQAGEVAPADPSLVNNGGAALPTWNVDSGSPSSTAATVSLAQQPAYSPPGQSAPYFWVNKGACGIGTTGMNLPPDCTPGVGSIPSPWGPGANNPLEALPVPTTPNPPQVSVPSIIDCAVSTLAGCDATASQSSANSYQPQDQGTCRQFLQGGGLSNGSQMSDCVIATSQQNVETFRGWSNRVPGDTVQPLEDQGFTQSLDNGFRAKAGPFSVQGSANSTYSGSNTISFKFRPDCWSPPSTGEDPSCATLGYEVGGYGWWSQWGLDLWRWEHHRMQNCNSSGTNCSTWDFEKVWDVSNGHGNDTSEQNALNGEGERPADVSNGAYGSAGHWNPDTGTQTIALGGSTSYSGSADIEISDSAAFNGSVSFSASSVDSTYQKFYNKVTLRGPNNGTPWMGGWYDYDANYSPHWSWDFWTCYFRPGWGPGAVVQSEAITPDHACWDYTAAGSPPLNS